MIFFTLTREYTNSEFLEEHKEAILNKKKEKKVNMVGPNQRARKMKDQHPNLMTQMGDTSTQLPLGLALFLQLKIV